MFDNAIFKGVKSDHRAYTARSEQAEGLFQAALKTAQLIIDGDSQRLKSPGRRMKAAMTILRRHRIGDNRGESRRGADMFSPAGIYDSARDSAGVTLFAVIKNQVRAKLPF